MSLDITPVIKGEAVAFKNPAKEFYEAVGGKEGMEKLMYSFYDKIYESDIAHFFPQDEEEFEQVKIKNTKFFIEICGGPKIYDENTNTSFTCPSGLGRDIAIGTNNEIWVIGNTTVWGSGENACAHIYYSKDNGNTWHQYGNGYGSRIEVDADGHIYHIGGNRTVYSLENGTWHNLKGSAKDLFIINTQ